MPSKGNLTWHPPFLVIFSLISHMIIVIHIFYPAAAYIKILHFYAKSLLFPGITDKLIFVIRSQRRESEEMTFIFIPFFQQIIFGLSIFILFHFTSIEGS